VRALVLSVLLAAPSAASALESGWGWQETLTSHFRVLHQATFLPPGFTMGLEKINSRLHMDLGLFTNWSSSGRVSVYLYRDQRSYAAGEFHPPPWSNGVAVYDKKAVAIPTMRTTAQMLRVLAHENTPVIFVNYFHEAHRDPPHWVNEGLAMLEEADSPDRPQASQWYQGMVFMDARRWYPLETFFRIDPTRDLRDDKKLVEIFYVQSYSLTHFLVRKHTPLQFKAFCDRLRDGQSVDDALRLAYHYRSVNELEQRWRQWLADPAHRRRVDALTLAERSADTGVVDQAGAAGSGGGGGFGSGFGSGFSTWKISSPSVFGRPLSNPNSGASQQP
jgi:hypothetical protein